MKQIQSEFLIHQKKLYAAAGNRKKEVKYEVKSVFGNLKRNTTQSRTGIKKNT